MTDTPTFNLLDEPWIKCMDGTNQPVTLSIRDVFSGRGDAYKVVGDSPTQDYAVLRVLLAIFWRAHALDLIDNYADSSWEDFDWPEWFDELREQLVNEKRDDVVLDYLDGLEDRFDLLSPIAPFMQVADLHTKSGATKPVSFIVPEAADDFFTMRTAEGRESLALDEAARWLIHAQAFDYSGIKSGAEGDPRVKGGRGYPIGTGWTGRTGGTIVLGEGGILETLILNTPPSAVLDSQEGGAVSADTPVWEREPDTAAQRPGSSDDIGAVPHGAVDLATWQARRIRLFFEGDRAVQVLVSNGDRIPDAGKNVMGDPMTPYRYSPNQSKKGTDAYYARPYDPTRTMWRALDALIALEDDPGFDNGKNKAPKRPRNLSNLAALEADGYLDKSLLDLALVSMEYGPQESSVASTFIATIGLPLVVLRADETGRKVRNAVRTSAEKTGKAAISLGWFAGQLLVAAGGDYEFGSSTADRFYARLEPLFLTWMAGLSSDNAEKRQIDWQKQVREQVLRDARALLRGAGTKAIVGREVDAGDSGKGRIVSAGSLYRQLHRRLDKDLPLTASRTIPGTGASGNSHEDDSDD
ncbi:type I-E CRISPR-associated protein Cse1/CasA [Corynebacterium guaraldiae]|uniref:Type I-E CRISPR-associated protein Cse1/CasA n=1 Tax=Corynebacterium guaraldiae TaxID=3051103 RepID=A0ABY3CUW7_9CORY|nr:type I-E CRISPR-associated protein Cse1/CasA [Corynebacterium guaraldiae]TRX34577.1 type I-E CRISPR-associated protein Cse1/CasA [Corynebacterium guaraldiae]TRX38229.1 type I-E CRISPR-associated protein Cse1/CasA [Corynebacterium guaraldiae]TRX49583.1 type I-E CRISPR-associated protein Cse1/CasA [Corynebacterium guaraldiae]TRX52583.1 type I-E CRISPR-associated protein Cse1/CasA [Corynebacterium guaraldiae]